MRLPRFSILLSILNLSLIGGGDSSTSTDDTIIADIPDMTIDDTVLPYVTDTTPDTTAPVITIFGLNPLNEEEGSTYVYAGAIVNNDRDGSVSMITEGCVNTDVVGTYLITYRATDSVGNR